LDSSRSIIGSSRRNVIACRPKNPDHPRFRPPNRRGRQGSRPRRVGYFEAEESDRSL